MQKQKRQQLTGLLIFGMVFLTFVFALHGSLLTRVIQQYDLRNSVTGFPSAASSAGGFIALISSLILNGRVSKLSLLKFGVGLCAAFLFLLPITSNFWLFVLFWAVIGIGLGYMDTLLSACMADLYQGDAVRRMMCILHLTYGLAFVAAPVVYASCLTRLDASAVAWNRLYLIVAAAGILLLGLLLAATGKVRESGKSADAIEEKISRALVKKLLGLGKGLLPRLMAAMLLHGVFLSSMSTWINRYEEVTLQKTEGIYALSFLFLGVMLSRLIMSFSKISTDSYIRVAGIAAFAAVIWMLFSPNAWMMYAALSVCGLFFGAMIPCMLTVSSACAPSHPMLVTTLMMLAFYLGQVIGPALTGALEAAASLQIGIGVSGMCIGLASVCCITARPGSSGTGEEMQTPIA